MANAGNLPQQFADYFLAQCAPEIGDRQLSAVPDNRYNTNYSVLVTFVNLPRGAGDAGGGTERVNNRIQFQVSGWAKDPAAAPSGGKVKVETLTSFSRDFKIRAKTATPAVIAKYLSDFIADVARKTKPKRLSQL
jgi:hypothetical protein